MDPSFSSSYTFVSCVGRGMPSSSLHQRSPTQLWQSMHGRAVNLTGEVLGPEARGAQEAVIAAV